MKNLLNNAIACAIVMSAFYGCSNEPIQNEVLESLIIESSSIQDACVDQDPQARITNNGSITITLEIVSIDGTALHVVEDITPGSSSGYLTFAPDDIIFNVDKDATGINDDKVVFTMDACMSYDMVLGADNYLESNVPTNL